jgi:RES domain
VLSSRQRITISLPFPVSFHHNLYLIKRYAGKHAAADGTRLNHILNAARRVVFKGLDSSFAHLSANAMAERAFHALRQLEGSPLPAGGRIQRQQTAFAVEINAERGLALQQHLTPESLDGITDPCSYAASQLCGDGMRKRHVQAFEAPSARSPETQPVVGVMTPFAFSTTPFDFQDWTLEITAEDVTAVCFGGGLTAQFTRAQFLVDGRWPTL